MFVKNRSPRGGNSRGFRRAYVDCKETSVRPGIQAQLLIGRCLSPGVGQRGLLAALLRIADQ